MFLGNDYSGKHCYDSELPRLRQHHGDDADEPHRGEPTIPLPADWAANYTQATHRMNCSDPPTAICSSIPRTASPTAAGC